MIGNRLGMKSFRVLIMRLFVFCFMLIPAALLGIYSLDCLFEATETGWHASKRYVIYLEPQPRFKKASALILGIGCFAAAVLYILVIIR